MTTVIQQLPTRDYWFEEARIINCVHLGQPHLGALPYSSYGIETYPGMKRRDGFSNPSWRAQVKAGAEATTPFTGTRDERIFTGSDHTELLYKAGFGSYQGDTVRLRGWGAYFTPGIPPDPLLLSIDAMRVEAQGRLISKIRATQRSFQGGVFLGELREAIHTIRNPLKSLRSLVTDYVGSARSRSRRIRHAKAKQKVIHDTWLEFQYGILPLASDIEQGVETLLELSPYFREIKRIQVGADTATGTTTSHSYAMPTEGFTVRWNRVARSFTKFRFTCGLGGQPVGGAFSSLEPWGVSLQDFVPTVWELIPYSFLVDYFTNAGKIIDAYAACSADIRWICYNSIQESRSDIAGAKAVDGLTTYGSQFISESCSSSANYHVRRVVVRDKWVGGLVPPFRFKLPGTGTQWLNVAALATQRKA